MSDKEELIAWEMLECIMCNPLESSRGNSHIVNYALSRASYFEEHGMVTEKLVEHRRMDAQ